MAGEFEGGGKKRNLIMEILKKLKETAESFCVVFDVSELSWDNIGRITNFCAEKNIDANIEVYYDSTSPSAKKIMKVSFED